jgi:hypothetical protein
MFSKSIRIASAAELDALIGQHITGEQPEIYWEDGHGQFQFDTEEEARRALTDPYFQRFLPDVDWSKTIIREVRSYRAYCAEPGLEWAVVAKATAAHGAVMVWREGGRWFAAFGTHPPADARTPAVALCLAALAACGFQADVNHDRVDAQISQYALQMLPVPAGQPL